MFCPGIPGPGGGIASVRNAHAPGIVPAVGHDDSPRRRGPRAEDDHNGFELHFVRAKDANKTYARFVEPRRRYPGWRTKSRGQGAGQSHPGSTLVFYLIPSFRIYSRLNS